MTDTQMRSFMQDFFEQYYQRLGQDGDGIALLRPLEESDRAMCGGRTPTRMRNGRCGS